MLFGIMADEYTDISSKELLSVCFRTVNEKLEGSEHFIGYYEIPNIKSDTIVNALKDAMIRTQQPLHKLLMMERATCLENSLESPLRFCNCSQKH